MESGFNLLGLRTEHVDWMTYSSTQVHVYKKRDFTTIITKIDELIVEDKCKVILTPFDKTLKNSWY